MELPKELADLVLADPFAEKGITKEKLDAMGFEEHDKLICELFEEFDRRNKNKIDTIFGKYGGMKDSSINALAIGNGKILAVEQGTGYFSDEYIKQLAEQSKSFVYLIGGPDEMLEIDGGYNQFSA